MTTIGTWYHQKRQRWADSGPRVWAWLRLLMLPAALFIYNFTSDELIEMSSEANDLTHSYAAYALQLAGFDVEDAEYTDEIREADRGTGSTSDRISAVSVSASYHAMNADSASNLVIVGFSAAATSTVIGLSGLRSLLRLWSSRPAPGTPPRSTSQPPHTGHRRKRTRA